jgi:hypothetical protein
MPARKRPTKPTLTPPSEDVSKKQDPKHTEAEFLRDLQRASTDQAGEAPRHRNRDDRAT